MIKKSQITVGHVYQNHPIVEYTWLHQQIEFFTHNVTSQPIPIAPPEFRHQFKQLIIDNIELFLLFISLIYVLSMFCVVKWYRRKQTKFQAKIQKEIYDELSNNSRKLSSEQSDEQQTINNQMVIERANSTHSSPSLSSDETVKVKGDLSFNELVPYGEEPVKPIDEQSMGQMKEIVTIKGNTTKITKEQRVQIERDQNNNTIKKIETQTLIHEIQANEETDDQLKSMEKKLIQYGSNDKKKKDVFKGLRIIEEEDFQKGTKFEQIDVVNDWSSNCENGRFQKMYKSHEPIGKVQKCLDQKLCAIKRIFFAVTNELSLQHHKIFREIDALQSFNHPNIVRYYTSWIEELETETLIKISQLKSLVNKPKLQKSVSHYSESNNNNFHEDVSYLDDMIQFNGDSNHKSLKSETVKDTLKESAAAVSFHPSEFSSSAESLMRRVHFNPKSNAHVYMLHIEMEYCEKNTLKDFIENVNRTLELQLVRDIFVQIVKGVSYIHKNNFIHRDLKFIFFSIKIFFPIRPQNIFLNSRNQVKIGDLGLSIYISQEQIEQPELKMQYSGSRTSNVGTPLYMAPEVKFKEGYSYSADVYALGIIYFEMLQKMKTTHERNRLIKELTEGNILSPNFIKQYPKESEIILKMTARDPSRRPACKEILQFLQAEK